MSSTVIRPAGVFVDPPGELRPLAVLVRDGRIASLMPLDPPIADLGADVDVIDLPDHQLFPGLINTHVHLSFSGSPTPLPDYLADGSAARLLRAVGNAHTLLRSGVTTARDCGSELALVELGRSGLPTPLPLPRLLMCGPPITEPAGHLHMMGGEAADADAIARLIRAFHEAGAGSIKVMATGGGMTPGTLPERATFSLDELRVAQRTAAALGLPTVAHVLAGEGIRRAALAGFDSLEHCAFFSRRDDGLLERAYDPAVARTVAEAGSSVMMGLSTAYRQHDEARRAGSSTPEERFALAQEERMFAVFARFRDLGVPLICGTDAGVKHTPFDETWLELVLMARAGLSPLEALRSATTRAAAALGRAGELGAVREGYLADLIALRRDPLDDPAALAEVDWVMRNGEVVVAA